MKNFRKMCRGEKGFTLIELLVVIIILGVLAAVVTLAVTRFIGKGALESANAEAVTVQAAIESCLADAGRASFTAASCAAGPWNGDNVTTPLTNNINPDTGGAYSCYDYLRTHTFKATYEIATDGTITGATNVDWGGTFTFNATTGKWEK